MRTILVPEIEDLVMEVLNCIQPPVVKKVEVVVRPPIGMPWMNTPKVEKPKWNSTCTCTCGCHNRPNYDDEIVVGTPKIGERRRKTVIDEPASLPPLGSAARPIPMPTSDPWKNGMVTREETVGYRRVEPTWIDEEDNNWWD